MAGTWRPVLLAVAESLEHWGLEPADRSDVDISWDIVFAAAQRHSAPNFIQRSDVKLDEMAKKLDALLTAGWLEVNVESPQTLYCRGFQIRDLNIENSSLSGEIADKPAGALWTSSRLPDGGSAWARSEASEFGALSRTLKYLDFTDIAPGDVFEIRSVKDYLDLVLEHPRIVDDGRVLVDWISVERSHIAVHLTAAGLARAQNFRVETRLGVAELRGWDAESTAWLRIPNRASLFSASRCLLREGPPWQ